MHSIDQKW